MKRPFRVLAGVLAAAIAGGALTACDTSPYAATVNGTVIKQTALNQELSYSDASPAYLDLVETIQQQTTGSATPPAGQGSGTHSKAWVDLQLTQLVQAAIVHQALVAQHKLPGQAMLGAARGVLEAELTPSGVSSMPTAYRDQLVQRLAEHAEIEQPGSNTAQMQQIYNQYKADFYTQVCVRQMSVTVLSPSGSIDFAASSSKASQIVSQINATHNVSGAASQSGGGAVACYTQAQMQDLSPKFITTVMGLAPGTAAKPQKTGAGYDVIAVTSRNSEAFSSEVARALFAAVIKPSADTAMLALDARAHVKVSRDYGTWNPGGHGATPGVVPPAVPASTPGA